MAVSTRGRVERRNSQQGQLQRPNLGKFYGRNLGDVRPGWFTFRITRILPRSVKGDASKLLVLDRYVEELDWADEGAVLTGNITLLRDAPDRPNPYVSGGHRIACDVRRSGVWFRLWEMSVQPPETDLDQSRTTLALTDDLILLHRTRMDWSFRTSKNGRIVRYEDGSTGKQVRYEDGTTGVPKGWLCHEIAQQVCFRLGIPIGKLAKGRHRIPRLVKKNATALEIIQLAYQWERNRSSVRFVIRLVNGKLQVVPLQRNDLLYVFHNQVQAAHVEQAQKLNPVTVLTGKGTIGKGREAKKVSYTEAQRAVIETFGRATKVRHYGHVESLDDLRQAVQRDYAKQLRIRFTGTITVPLIPYIRRGDGIQWVTREPGWYGRGYAGVGINTDTDVSFVYVKAARYTVTSDEQTLEMDLTQDDPYWKDAKRKAAEARKRKAGTLNLSGFGGTRPDTANSEGGTGDWITVGATVYDDPPPGAFGGSLSFGYAELGTAGANAGLGPLLAQAIGRSGELPEDFAFEVRNPSNGRVVTLRKRDRGSGQPGDRFYKIDIWTDGAQALGLDPVNFKGPVQIRQVG